MPFKNLHKQHHEAELAMCGRSPMEGNLHQCKKWLLVSEVLWAEKVEAFGTASGIANDCKGPRGTLPFKKIFGCSEEAKVAMPARASMGNCTGTNQKRPLVSDLRGDPSVGQYKKDAYARKGDGRKMRIQVVHQQRLSPSVGMRFGSSVGGDSEQYTKRNMVSGVFPENTKTSKFDCDRRLEGGG